MRKTSSPFPLNTSRIPRGIMASADLEGVSVPRGFARAQEMIREMQERGIRAGIMAAADRGSGDAAVAIRELTAGIEGFKSKFQARLDEMEAHLDDQAKTAAFAKLGGSGLGAVAADPEYTKLFASFIRRGAGEDEIKAAQAAGGRQQIQAAMSVGSNPDGGYVAPVEWDRKVQQAQVAISPMRQLAQVRTTSVGAYSTLWNGNNWGSGWVGETASRPATTSASLSSLIFPTGEIYANIAVTQRLLDDALVDMDNWIVQQASTEFDRQEGIAFLAGDGANKPVGLLQYTPGGAADATAANAATNALVHPGGNLSISPSGAAAGLTSDGLVDFMYALAAPYRQNATWLMNSLTGAALSKLKDGQGNYIWRESILADQPPTLLGRPVKFDENMPNIAAGALAVAFGDFRSGYVINDRIGVRVLRDPYTNKPFVMLYLTKRVGGGLLDPRAIRLLKIAAN